MVVWTIFHLSSPYYILEMHSVWLPWLMLVISACKHAILQICDIYCLTTTSGGRYYVYNTISTISIWVDPFINKHITLIFLPQPVQINMNSLIRVKLAWPYLGDQGTRIIAGVNWDVHCLKAFHYFIDCFVSKASVHILKQIFMSVCVSTDSF